MVDVDVAAAAAAYCQLFAIVYCKGRPNCVQVCVCVCDFDCERASLILATN